jgi:hypothetical protein
MRKPCALRKLRGLILRARTASEWDITREMISEEKSITQEQRGHFLALCESGQWRVAAKSRKPAEWVALLNTIEDQHIRGKVASIVWWDYASKMPEVFKVMALYGRDQFETAAQVFDGLRAVGYPEKLARKRCQQPKDSSYRPQVEAVP